MFLYFLNKYITTNPHPINKSVLGFGIETVPQSFSVPTHLNSQSLLLENPLNGWIGGTFLKSLRWYFGVV